MPFTTHPATPGLTPTHPVPQHLDHKPVYALPYEAFDGPYAGRTDVQYFTVGVAQYDADEVSVKTMRHTGSKWTRQAEELPPHRPIDLTLFLAKAIFDAPQGAVTLPAGTMQNQTADITVTQEQRNFGEMASFNAALARVAPHLKQRLNVLRDVLNDLKKRGCI